MTKKTIKKPAAPNKVTPASVQIPSQMTAQMQVVKVTCRSKAKGERRFPYRVLGLALNADLVQLAGAILNAFEFDHDHAYGFFDTKDPYGSNIAFELFSDANDSGENNSGETNSGDIRAAYQPGNISMDMISGETVLPGEMLVPNETEMAMMLGLEAVDKHAIMLETAEFLTRRLQEQMLPLIPERLREAVRGQLAEFAAELMDMSEEDEAMMLPPEAQELLAEPGGVEQLLTMFQAAAQMSGVPGGGTGLNTGQKQEYGVTGVALSTLFGIKKDWTFLFDYGDDWMFDLTDQGVKPAEPRKKLPTVIETLGKAPEQYPDWDDDE